AGAGDGDVSRGVSGGQLPAHGGRRRRSEHGRLQQCMRGAGGGAAAGDRAAGDTQGGATDPRRSPRGPWVGPVGSPQGPGGFAAAAAACTLQSVHSDRFVVQARVRSSGGDERVYALKTYSDDFGERVWTHAQQLAERLPPRPHRPCLPIQYIPQERVLIFDWVEGRSLSKIVDGRKLELLRHAAVVA